MTQPPRTKARTKSQLGKTFQSAVRKAIDVNSSAKKVPIDNKIGRAPDGWLGTVAFALQRGIHREIDHPLQNVLPSKDFDFPQPAFAFELVMPELFHRARAACGIKTVRYVAALEAVESCRKPTLSVIDSSDASGKSASFFFLSPDQQFLAKSLDDKDSAALLSILPDYVRHLEEEPSSLLPRYLGLYRLDITDDELGRPRMLWIGVMPNLFAGIHIISQKYDLKGSTAGRTASGKERAKSRPVFKDNDWVRSGQRICLPSTADRNEFLRLVKCDAELLARHQLMDYSLLIGVHYKDNTTEKSAQQKYEVKEANNVITVETDENILYVGIVDVLTRYDRFKRCETMLSGTLRCRNCSCQPPSKYAKRFADFITASVSINGSSKAFGMWNMKTGNRKAQVEAAESATPKIAMVRQLAEEDAISV